jgi:hypothetical protein
MNHVNFTGDCDDFLREVVSYCLALAIYARLNEFDSGDIPPYRRSDHQLVRR